MKLNEESFKNGPETLASEASVTLFRVFFVVRGLPLTALARAEILFIVCLVYNIFCLKFILFINIVKEGSSFD